MRAHDGMNAVGADQHVAAHVGPGAIAPLEGGPDAQRVLFKA